MTIHQENTVEKESIATQLAKAALAQAMEVLNNPNATEHDVEQGEAVSALVGAFYKKEISETKFIYDLNGLLDNTPKKLKQGNTMSEFVKELKEEIADLGEIDDAVIDQAVREAFDEVFQEAIAEESSPQPEAEQPQPDQPEQPRSNQSNQESDMNQKYDQAKESTSEAASAAAKASKDWWEATKETATNFWEGETLGISNKHLTIGAAVIVGAAVAYKVMSDD